MSTQTPTPQQPETPDETGTNANGGGTDAGNALTQEQVNQLIGRTRTETRERATADLLLQFGVETPEQLTEQLQRLREMEQSQLSEQERLQQQVADLNGQLEAQRAANEAAAAQMQQLRIAQAIQTAATSANFRNPADALALVDTTAVTINDDGTISGADTAVEALARQRPYLVNADTAVRQPRPARPIATQNGQPATPKRRRKISF
jgi:hypothetical protein